MTAVEFAGQDLAEAIALAAGALNLPPEQLKFNILETGTKGFLGLGRRRARITVDPADPVHQLLKDESAPRPSAPPSAAEVEPPAAPELVSAAKKSVLRPASARLKVPSSRPLPDLAPLTRPAVGETREDDPQDETARLTRTVVGDILSRLGLAADLTVVRLGPRLVVNLDGPDRALLIGARGATLEALQLLVSKIVAKKKPGERGQLVLDVADYRFRRHSQVLENLRQQVETARRTGQPQALIGLRSSERRLVRLALRSLKDLDLKAGPGREGLVLAARAPEPGSGARRKRKDAPR